MKSLIIGMVILGSLSTFACDSKSEKRGITNLVFENESMQIIEVKSIWQSIGCLEWGVHPKVNKNKLCRDLTGEKEAKYIKGSSTLVDIENVRGPLGLFGSSKSLGSILCKLIK